MKCALEVYAEYRGETLVIWVPGTAEMERGREVSRRYSKGSERWGENRDNVIKKGESHIPNMSYKVSIIH